MTNDNVYAHLTNKINVKALKSNANQIIIYCTVTAEAEDTFLTQFPFAQV